MAPTSTSLIQKRQANNPAVIEIATNDRYVHSLATGSIVAIVFGGILLLIIGGVVYHISMRVTSKRGKGIEPGASVVSTE